VVQRRIEISCVQLNKQKIHQHRAYTYCLRAVQAVKRYVREGIHIKLYVEIPKRQSEDEV